MEKRSLVGRMPAQLHHGLVLGKKASHRSNGAAILTSGSLRKVAINACINPLTAVHGVKNGALLSEPYLARAEQIIAEVENILTELGYAQLASRLDQTVRAVMADTADNTSSMLSDVMAGRRTEVDSIVGWLLHRSKREHAELQAMLNQLQSIEPTS